MAETNPGSHSGSEDHKNSDTLKKPVKQITIMDSGESTHWYRMFGNAAAGPVRALTSPCFGSRPPRNLRWCGSSNLNMLLVHHLRWCSLSSLNLLLGCHLRPHPHFRLRATPSLIHPPRRKGRRHRLKARYQTNLPQADNLVRSKLRLFPGPRWDSCSLKR